ncbi:DHS-like NAD/FAD-binding domain-containing protein [Suillus bovinus]|uniref:DHS-like NAD/FAD-binding domain-containing protein n=1 Tax=Suillus bovinus TaxID=48563 RepID=UPI001B86B75F|nr:DHS-like NAD/FAD-binding domain-containing protein [Suillus bovinus]KAG2157681.1 DHS-like NAD/FAD-binding domain-containing protein [Suillus bovinus]
MRVSVPTIISSSGAPKQTISPAAAVGRIAEFLAPGKATLITGAGVSVASGIRAYRGKDGRYMNPNYQPIFYHELADQSEKGFAFRQRYWLRSYLGYPPVRDTLPNTSHYAIAALQYASYIPRLVTQNVDGLHHKAIAHLWEPDHIQKQILELHGTLHRVHCKRGHVVPRDTFQDWLSASNPQWKAFVDNLEKTGQKLRTNPDGDVELEGVSYTDFVVPECPQCTLEGQQSSFYKPELIFFGESIPSRIKDRSFHDVEESERVFVLGTTLATYSAFRLVKRALEMRKPVMLLNVGPTRADELPGVEKLEISSSLVLRDVVRAILGSRASQDSAIVYLLQSGIHQPPAQDHEIISRNT